jgi:hypothetical protein
VRKGSTQFLYINGTLVDSTVSLISSSKARLTALAVAIGKFVEYDGKAGNDYFNGVIDEVRVQSLSVSHDWIKLCYMNQRQDDKLVVFK